MERFKRKLFIVANTYKIKGVGADVDNYIDFFRSEVGGLWIEEEINVKYNLSATKFADWINYYKSLSLDYFVFVFCGHGFTRKECLEMIISGMTQLANERDIAYIADRQLNIFDCCREVEEDDDLEPITESQTICFSDTKIGNVRERYNRRIKQAFPQCSSLYACSIGECARCSNKGGYFSQYLLQSARNIDGLSEKTIGRCHTEASTKMERLHPKQTPDYSLPRCLPKHSLILSIHP